MKMPIEVYEKLKADIKQVAKALNIDIKTADAGKSGLKTMYALKHKVSTDRAFNDDHPAFKSGTWTRILPFDGRDYCFYYAGGCNDTHVETALRRIKSEMEAE